MSLSTFETSFGFPRSDVRLSNWRQVPWNVWSFRHVTELIPTARIAAMPGVTEEPPVSSEDLVREEFSVDGERTTASYDAGHVGYFSVGADGSQLQQLTNTGVDEHLHFVVELVERNEAAPSSSNAQS